jgi:streptomycin 6-kinase
LVRARLATLGAEGVAWESRLPQTLAELESLWSVRLGRPLPGGSAAYVAQATTTAGETRVVKVALPDDDLVAQARTLAAADGRGYARLHAFDASRCALLMESLGTSLDRLAWPPELALPALADTLLRAWSLPLDTAPEVAPGDDKASTLRVLVSDLWSRLDGPCPRPVIDQAIAFADRRAAAFDAERCVVVHGDPHPSNTLRVPAAREGAESGFVLVDPDGFRCDPAYDLGVALRDWSSRLDGPRARSVLEGYCALLAARTGIDAQRIWEWGYLERVSTGLYVMGFGAERVGRPFLDTAARLLD